jgi:hypothetical protein
MDTAVSISPLEDIFSSEALTYAEQCFLGGPSLDGEHAYLKEREPTKPL